MVLKKHHLILTVVVLALGAGALFIFTRSPEDLIPSQLVESPAIKSNPPKITTPQHAAPVIEQTVAAPTTPAAPSPATVSISPERMEEIKANNTEVRELNAKHRAEKRALKDRQRELRRQMRAASPEERKAQKQRDRAEMKALSQRQKEETAQVRGDHGMSGDEMKAFLELKRAERAQQVQSARSPDGNVNSDGDEQSDDE